MVHVHTDPESGKSIKIQGPLFKMQIQFIFTFSNFILNISLDFNQIKKSSKIEIGMLEFTPMDIKLQTKDKRNRML